MKKGIGPSGETGHYNVALQGGKCNLDIRSGREYIEATFVHSNLAQSVMRFDGKTAVVTGGTGGLGRVVCSRFLEQGARVAVPYASERSIHVLAGLGATYGDRLFTTRVDLTDEGIVQRFVDDVHARYGSIDILVNAAGGYVGGSTIDEVSIDDWERAIKLNLKTAFLMCRSTLKKMKHAGTGRIINIAAMTALNPAARRGPYQISKRALVTLTETIAQEVKGISITANAIAPSTILTEDNKRSMPDADFTQWVTPEEIAALILFLCSDDARSISGNVIKIYGGGA